MIRKSVFVAMPFAERFDLLYRDAIAPAASDVNLHINKLGALRREDVVPQMERQIGRSDLFLAVATDRNAHVFLEIGLAHAARKPCIILAEEASHVQIFSDRHQCITYSTDMPRLRAQLRDGFARLMNSAG